MRRPRLSRAGALTAVVGTALSLGCGEGDVSRSSAWAGAVDTLPGGAVRVTNPAAGLWESADSTPWELVPEFTLGELDGAPEDVFSSISGLAADNRGRILVLDRETAQLRFYDADGAYLFSVGRKGEGPGEYNRPNGLEILSSDSVVVIDQEAYRYTVLGPDGGYGRTLRRELPFYSWLFRGGVDGDLLYELFAVRNPDERAPALFGTSLRDQEAPVDTVLVPVVEPPEADYSPYELTGDEFSSYLGVPFAPGQSYTVDRQGGLWLGGGHRFRLLHVSLTGDTLREVLLENRPTVVTPAERDEWLTSEVVVSFKERGARIDEGRIPTTKPHFDDIALDHAGNLWVSIPTRPMRVEFALFDPAGRYLGRMGFDGAERVYGMSPVVANGRLYVAIRDELDVNRVAVFRIEVTPPASAGS